jgi:hypothetical protein
VTCVTVWVELPILWAGEVPRETPAASGEGGEDKPISSRPKTEGEPFNRLPLMGIPAWRRGPNRAYRTGRGSSRSALHLREHRPRALQGRRRDQDMTISRSPADWAQGAFAQLQRVGSDYMAALRRFRTVAG